MEKIIYKGLERLGTTRTGDVRSPVSLVQALVRIMTWDMTNVMTLQPKHPYWVNTVNRHKENLVVEIEGNGTGYVPLPYTIRLFPPRYPSICPSFNSPLTPIWLCSCLLFFVLGQVKDFY